MKLPSALSLLHFQSFLSNQSVRSRCDDQSAALSFSETWQILGPFQIGTREATWGVDPLETHGGFSNLPYDKSSTFQSSLAPNASVSWSVVEPQSSSCSSRASKLHLVVDFPDIDWAFMQSIYGWAALQYQGWARGAIFVHGDSPKTITLSTVRVLEFRVDGVLHFGADYYGYGTVPLVLHLQPGKHVIEIRLVRDVRSMGGIGQPTVDVSLAATLVSEALHTENKALLPDLVNAQLAGSLGSITVRNDATHDIHVSGISINDTAYFAWLAQPSNIRVTPGQTRPIALVISCRHECSPYIRIDVEYERPGHGLETLSVHQTISERATYEPHKRTFLHPGGMVSYAIVRAPTSKLPCPRGSENKLPILIQLHGAGVEADSDLVRHALDPVPDLCAWVLFPTGSTPWSGDDWHTWGFADVEAAVHSLAWLEIEEGHGTGVDTDTWLVSGHSNGGQGTWHALTHRPDKIGAAAPVSGYSSIQNYVPYDLWRPMDPSARALLDAALGSYKNERLLANVQQIPILQQHGSIDDNVPAFHSRLMSLLVRQAGGNSTYIELDGANHYFDGVMTTKPLTSFYQRHLNGFTPSMNAPENFSLVVANPADMGSRHGILVLQISRFGQLGRVDVSFSPSKPICFIQTSNVLHMELPAIYARTHELVIDGQSIPSTGLPKVLELWRRPDGSWQRIDSGPSPALRHGRQLGPMDAVLRTRGALEIVRSSRLPAVDRITLQISRNLCQYFGADTEIVDRPTTYTPRYSNIIRVAIGLDLSGSYLYHFPITTIRPGVVTLRGGDGLTRTYNSSGGLGAIFLRPLSRNNNDQVELVVWGADEEGLEVAARLVPMLTGVGQPDFVVADKRMLWGGAGEVLAMGYFDHRWNVTSESYLT